MMTGQSCNSAIIALI